MASFTDPIPQFKEYVPQLPVEAMVTAGMFKQQRYEENVQKIQSQIDNIAGLDILKDVDKNYLQSKLNELGNQLTTVAAGDFSNFQLVNSVSGMTGQIVKDKNVQNAVSSTAWYRKQQKAIEEARKQGKSNIANEDLFNAEVSKWLNNNEVGSSFSSEYVPYTDVFKKLQEIAKSVGEDSTIVQQLFQTDANGNPILINGKLQYNDVMAETLLKGKDKNKILNAFQYGLDANDYRQLGISGRYELRGKTQQELEKYLDDGFLEYQKISLLRKDEIQDKILELKNKGGSKKDIDSLQEMVLKIDNDISKRRANVDKMKSADPDTIRGSIYTNNYLDSMSSAFSTKDVYTKYSKNPAVEMMLDRERLKLDANRFKLEQDKFTYQKSHDAQKMAQERWKALFEKGLVDENGMPTGAGLYSGGARDLPITDQTNPLYFTDQFEQGLRDDMNAQFKLYEKVAIADWMAKNSGRINLETGKPYTTDDIKKGIVYWASQTGHTYNDYIVLQGQKAADKYNQSKGKSLGAEYAEDFRAINELGNRIGINKKKMDGEQAYIAANAIGFTPVGVSKIDIKPITVTAVIGGAAEGMGQMRRQNVTLSKQDVLDFAKFIYHNSEGGFIPGFLDSPLVKKQADDAKSRLVKKYGTAGFESIQRSIRGREGISPSDMNPFNLLFNMPSGTSEIQQHPEIKKAIDLISNDAFRKTMTLKEQYYKGISEVGVPKGVTLYKDKSEQKEHLKTALTNVSSDYAGIDDSYQDLITAVADDKSQFQINIDPAASRYGKNAYNLQVTKSDGSIVTKPITESHYQFITGKQAPSLFVDDVLSSIKASPYGSTNLTYSYTDDNAYSTAFIKDYQTRTKNYNVAMDFVLGSGNLLFPKIYLQIDENNWKLIPYNAGLTPEQAKNFPISVDDVFIKSLLQSK